MNFTKIGIATNITNTTGFLNASSGLYLGMCVVVLLMVILVLFVGLNKKNPVYLCGRWISLKLYWLCCCCSKKHQQRTQDQGKDLQHLIDEIDE